MKRSNALHGTLPWFQVVRMATGPSRLRGTLLIWTPDTQTSFGLAIFERPTCQRFETLDLFGFFYTSRYEYIKKKKK